MMRINVGGKLWIAFFATICLCVFSLYLLLHNSLKQGFLDYTSQQAVQRLTILSTTLNKIHSETGSFLSLQSDPERWLKLKNIIFAESDELFSSPQGENPATDESLIELQQQQQYYREFVASISLHDTNKALLLGFLKPKQTLSWIPITQSGTIIGFISFVKPTVVTRQADKRFVQHQFKVFGIISILVLLISTAVATLLARRISRPLMALAEGAEALSAGDYSRTMKVTSRDEIGQVCQSFNQLAQALAANEKLRAHWIADVSHEMRTPLSVLKVQIEAMQDGIRPTNHENLSLLYNKVIGLNTLIDDLFELSLSDIGALNYNKTKTPIYTFTKNCVQAFQVKVQSAQLTLTESIEAASEILILADTKRLEQLLSNLLENAIRYTNTGGCIDVKLTHSNEHVIITIDDSEPGVPELLQEKIFERLYRIEDSRSRSTGGAGLGLSICKNIVTAHQGTITASASPSGGLRINIRLPRIKS